MSLILEGSTLTKSQVLRRLKKTITKLSKLKKENFNYELFVDKWNKEKQCGTVCCVAGWYPKWFPEAGLIWTKRSHDLSAGKGVNGGWSGIEYKLMKYHGLTEKAIGSIFYGRGLYERESLTMEVVIQQMVKDVQFDMDRVTVKQVTARFKKILKFVQLEFDSQEGEILKWREESL